MATTTNQLELLNKAFELLEKKLLPAKLASTGVDGRGNGFSHHGVLHQNYKGREAATPDALATIFYEAVLKDVNDESERRAKGSTHVDRFAEEIGSALQQYRQGKYSPRFRVGCEAEARLHRILGSPFREHPENGTIL